MMPILGPHPHDFSFYGDVLTSSAIFVGVLALVVMSLQGSGNAQLMLASSMPLSILFGGLAISLGIRLAAHKGK